MKRLVLAVLVLLSLASGQTAQEHKGKRLVLPNPKLLRCQSSDCFQLWTENPGQPNVVFPKRVSIDMNEKCPYGMEALYDKSIPLEDVKAAIDEAYGKWTYLKNDNGPGPVKLWRVESEKFAISLSVADKKDEEMNIADEGAKHVIYVAFGGRSACLAP